MSINDDKVEKLRQWHHAEKSERGLIDMEFYIPSAPGIEEVAAEVLSVVKDKQNNSVRIRCNDDF